MLTKDENIVSVAVTVQYRIDNPQTYLFNVSNPIESLKQATASAMRQVIGLYNLDDIMTTGREQIRTQIEQTLREIVARYNSGIQVTNVSIKSASAPEEVKEAFDDAIKAREDQQRFINQAQAYAMKVGPIAQGQAQQIIEIANADAQKFVLEAQANTAAFIALLPQYASDPKVMRERLYLDAMENILKNSSKILLDSSSSNNVFYLPLDKMIKAITSLGTSLEIKNLLLKKLKTRKTQFWN
jgi:membrane protease subunit HflK